MSALTLGPDWKLHSQTTGTVDMDETEVNIGPLKMRVTQLWDRYQDELSRPLFKAFDKQIGNDVKIRPQAEKLVGENSAADPRRQAPAGVAGSGAAERCASADRKRRVMRWLSRWGSM